MSTLVVGYSHVTAVYLRAKLMLSVVGIRFTRTCLYTDISSIACLCLVIKRHKRFFQSYDFDNKTKQV